MLHRNTYLSFNEYHSFVLRYSFSPFTSPLVFWRAAIKVRRAITLFPLYQNSILESWRSCVVRRLSSSSRLYENASERELARFIATAAALNIYPVSTRTKLPREWSLTSRNSISRPAEKWIAVLQFTTS